MLDNSFKKPWEPGKGDYIFCFTFRKQIADFPLKYFFTVRGGRRILKTRYHLAKFSGSECPSTQKPAQRSSKYV